MNEENPKKLPITVLLAEDQKQMRAAILLMLQEEPGIQVVGEASTLAETLQLAAELKPNVVLMDLHMPGGRDFEPSVVKTQLLLSCRLVLAMSIWQDAETQVLAQSYGATHLLDKMKLEPDLLPAIIGCP
jgi:DNA-binding NarL/FixJ family response regulator